MPCAFQPLDSSKLPSPCMWNWTPRMRDPLSGGSRKLLRAGTSPSPAATQGSSQPTPMEGKGKDRLSFPSGRLLGSGLRGDWCSWRRDRHVLPCGGQTRQDQDLLQQASQPCWGRGAPHLLRTPCSKEGEPLVSCSCPGHPPVPPACTGGLPAGLLRRLTAVGSLLASQSRPAAPRCSARGLLASLPLCGDSTTSPVSHVAWKPRGA